MPRPKTKVARVALPATCGELFQGTLDGVPCLVSCPIDRYSTAKVQLRSTSGWDVPAEAPKTRAALQAGLQYLNQPNQGGCLQLETDIPRSRGYGSSTADIGATLYALATVLRRRQPARDAARLAVRIEPSDSTVFPALTLFDHRCGTFHETLGPAPPLEIIVLDPGGAVDTLAFNQRDHRTALTSLASQHEQAFDMLCDGLQRGDWDAVGAAATLSARAHQAILANPLLESALSLASDIGALGVCRAHSGTLLGLLLNPTDVDVPAALDFVRRHLPEKVTLRHQHLIDGGPKYETLKVMQRAALPETFRVCTRTGELQHDTH